jgi:hypothetical protein
MLAEPFVYYELCQIYTASLLQTRNHTIQPFGEDKRRRVAERGDAAAL